MATTDRPAFRRTAALALCAVGAAFLTVIAVPRGQAAPVTGTSAPSLRPVSLLDEVAVVPGGSSPAAVVPLSGHALGRPSALARDAGPDVVARAFLDRLGSLYGVTGSSADLRLDAVDALGGGDRAVRYQQMRDGLPVYGGELVVQLDGAGSLLSVTGETAPATSAASRGPGVVSASAARAIASRDAAGLADTRGAILHASAPNAYVYDPSLVGDAGTRIRTVWDVFVSGPPSSGVVVEVLVDASSGAIVKTLDRSERLSRSICDDHDSRNTDVADGSWCYPKSSTYLASVDSSHPQAVEAYDELGAVSDFYAQVLGVDLTQQVGLDTSHPYSARSDPVLTATVRFCDIDDSSCPYPNSFWVDADPSFQPGGGRTYPGGQIYLGDGLVASPDVIGHEVTHGVTSSVNALKYVNQSGAIDESMSDVFGELSQLYDSSTGSFDNSRDPHWLIGERLDGPTLYGALRSMSNPSSTTLPEGDPQPDHMTSRYWVSSSSDNGGVHANSGVGNKTAYLIARGGTFRGVHVGGIGDAATARLYWRVQNLLTSGSSYRDLGADLSIACDTLFGESSGTCGSVRAATKATQISVSTVSVSVSRSSVAYGHATTVRGRLRSARGQAMYVRGSEGVTLALERRNVGSSRWTGIGRRAVGTSGTASWSVRPVRNSVYRVLYGGSPPLGLPGSHGDRTVSVRPTLSRGVSASDIRRGSSFVVSGAMRPARPGAVVDLQRRVHGRWHSIYSQWLSTSSRFRIRYRPGGRGLTYYRMYRPKGSVLAAGTSSVFAVRVS